MYVADMHCDTISEIYQRKKRGIDTKLSKNDLQIDLLKLERGNYLLQNFAVFVDLENGENPYQCAKNQIALFQREIQKNSDRIRQVKTYQDILDNQKQGRISALLTLEEGEACEGDIKKLEEFYELGVRMMTFTWNYQNSYASPATPLKPLAEKQKHFGLTECGIAFLEKMEELGIIPDVSHLSEEGFYDVYRYSTKPFVASHSNAVSLCEHGRNLTDDMIRKIAQRGGVIGINYYGRFLENHPVKGIYYSRISRIADHILYMIKIGGEDCVGLGSDFDGMDNYLELSDCSKMELLWDELKKRGLHERQIEAVFFKNLLRLYREMV